MDAMRICLKAYVSMAFLCAVWSTPLYSASSKEADMRSWSVEQRYLYFGIPVQLQFTPANASLKHRAWMLLEEIDTVFNDYQEQSEIATINTSQCRIYTLSPLLARAFQESQHLNNITEGVFDITTSAFRCVWENASRTGVYPSVAQLDAAKILTGNQGYTVEERKLHIHRQGVKFDFGGIVKGMAVDRVVSCLRQKKITSALVQVGGETACYGHNSHGRRHRIAIAHPYKPDTFYTIVQDQGTGLSLCTSGNYRKPITIQGKKYYHIFDPYTGKPGNVHTLSVTVLFPQTGQNALADGLATAGVIMDVSKFVPLVESLGGEALVLVAGAGDRIIEYKSEQWGVYARDQ